LVKDGATPIIEAELVGGIDEAVGARTDQQTWQTGHEQPGQPPAIKPW